MIGVELEPEKIFYVDPDDRANESYEGPWRKAYTDGSSIMTDDPRFTRAGYGLHFALEHAGNVAKPLRGLDQSSYRAEVRAVVEAVETTDTPLLMPIDNEAVAKTAARFALPHHPPSTLNRPPPTDRTKKK